jgi:23S rRNA pseudouridine1911/1915/1917 synthase
VSESDPIALKATAEQAGSRVEKLVMDATGCTRSEARALCSRGDVRLNGRRAKKGERIESGDELVIRLPESWVAAEPERELDVRLEREDLVVVGKPAGVPSVPLQPGERGTIANALVARYPEMREFGYAAREPGLVHRLDTQTSGLLLAARSAVAFDALVRALQNGALEKRYLALVGNSAALAESGKIEGSLEPDRERHGRVIVARSDAKYHRFCVTDYRVVSRGKHFALLELTASPAFRHQVRAHLASIGHPIAGDTLYGGEAHALLGSRHALHASYLAYGGDAAVPAFRVSDEAPAEFAELLDRG